MSNLITSNNFVLVFRRCLGDQMENSDKKRPSQHTDWIGNATKKKKKKLTCHFSRLEYDVQKKSCSKLTDIKRKKKPKLVQYNQQMISRYAPNLTVNR